MQKGILLILSGPSGVGKGTVGKQLLTRSGGSMVFSVSCTTRAPREGEENGREYFFITEEKFQSMIQNGEFLEYMNVFGKNHYGTPREYVEKQLNAGRDVLLDIDVNGAMSVKANFPNAIAVMLVPPSMKELRSRLEGRGTETQEAVERRLAEAATELSYMPRYDYIVVNDDIDIAVAQCEQVIESARLRPVYCRDFVDALINEEF